jgi:hypothetical protein
MGISTSGEFYSPNHQHTTPEKEARKEMRAVEAM